MPKKNNRNSDRKPIRLTTFVRKELPGGGYSIMQFISRDLSEGGIFISTDDLTLFDLGEELSIIVDRDRKRLFEGKAIAVRSARVYDTSDSITESGFGLMFTDESQEFSEMVRDLLSSVDATPST